MLWLVGSRIHYPLRTGPAKCLYRSVPCVHVLLHVLAWLCVRDSLNVCMHHNMCLCVLFSDITVHVSVHAVYRPVQLHVLVCTYITVHVFGYCNLYIICTDLTACACVHCLYAGIIACASVCCCMCTCTTVCMCLSVVCIYV